MCVRETSRDIFISKQFVCEVKSTENGSWILIFALFLENIGPNCFNVPLFLRLRLRDIYKRSCSWFARDSPSKQYFTDQPFMNETWWCTKNSCLETQMLGEVKADTNRKCPIDSLKQICMDQARLLATKTARDKIINCFCEEWYRLNIHRPFRHYDPVSKDKEVRTRLGWTISYKSPHLSTWASGWCLCLQEYRKGLWDRTGT